MPRRPDDDPAEWRTALPIRSPIPLLLALVVAQVAVAVLLVAVGVIESSTSKPTSSFTRNR